MPSPRTASVPPPREPRYARVGALDALMRASRPERTGPLLAAAFLLGACASDDGGRGDGAWRGERAQRGDTTIVRTLSGSVWGDTMTLVPELAIGELDGPPAYLFGRITGLDVDGQGRILVVDAQAQEVRVFSPDGGHLRTLGRPGGGPGEFRRADHVRVASDGRIIVRDAGAGRFTLFSDDGEPAGQWLLGTGFGTTRPFALDDEDRVLNPTFSDRLVRYDLAGTPLDTLPNPTRGFSAPSLEVASDGGTATYPIPFTPSESWTVTRDGRLVFGTTDRYAFEVWDPDGGVLRVERVEDPVAVESGEAAAARDQLTRVIRAGNDRGWRWRGGEIPATKPYWSSILTGVDGTFWVRRQTAATEEPNPSWDPERPDTSPRTRWTSPAIADVFDEDGRYRGAVKLPAEVRSMPPPVVSAERVWAVSVDELGVPRVVRFRLEPESGG